MSPVVLLLVYVGLILLASLAGGWIPIVVTLTHKRMQIAVSLIAGFMLGVGLLHMLPHAIEASPGSLHGTMLWLLLGFLVMFFIERFFSFHQHDVPVKANAIATADAGHSHDHSHHHDHAHGRHHHHHHGHGAAVGPGAHGHRITWSGAALGLTLHSLLDGLALAASIDAAPNIAWAGLAVFLVIFLHRPLDSMTLLTLMSVGGWSRPARHLVNALFALVVPVGAALYFGLSHWSVEAGHEIVGPALAFSAGLFLCISMSDLLPELQFHQHDRVGLSAALMLGLALAWTIAWLEPEHQHDHEAPAPVHLQHDHEH